MSLASSAVSMMLASRSNICRRTACRTTSLAFSCSSRSGRRTFASRLLAQGHTIESVQFLLGYAELDHVAPHLEVKKQELREAMAEAGDHWK